jgi:hypothetical protein
MILRCLLPLLAFMHLGCKPSPPSTNQISPSTSPSGQFVLTMPIQRHTTNPRYTNTSVWKVTISTPTGQLLYKDEESTFVGMLNVYWQWDSADRVWLYNSDDGRVHYWQQENTQWKKHEHSGAATAPIPPPSLFPDYLKTTTGK